MARTSPGARTGADVLRDVVATLAPDELSRLDEACREYAENPYPPQRGERGGGGVLTAGVDTAVLLPVLIAFVAQLLADVAADAVRKGGGALSRRWARRRRRREGADERRAALTNAAPDTGTVPVGDLLRWAREHARDCRLPATDADHWAQVLIIALTPPPDAASGTPEPDPADSGAPEPGSGPAAVAPPESGPPESGPPESGPAEGGSPSAGAAADPPAADPASGAAAPGPGPDTAGDAPAAGPPFS
ncbi:hypothetical protein ACWDR0_12915 [Streptomyces sp. NPDC003691]